VQAFADYFFCFPRFGRTGGWKKRIGSVSV